MPQIDPIRNLDYTVPGDKGTLTVQAQVDTSLAEKNAPVASLSRADFTDADIQTYADLLFDEGSYSLFMPYEFRSIEDLSAPVAPGKIHSKAMRISLRSRNI